MPAKPNPAAELFRAKDAEPIYSAIVKGLKARVGAGNAVEDPKNTCVHVTAGKGGTAYLGLHPRKGGVLVTIRTAKPIPSDRIRKAEQVSANRCHCDVLLSDPAEVDDEFLGWAADACGLVAGK